jgi:hypothetical protein
MLIDNGQLSVGDHLTGFDKNYFSPILDQAVNEAKKHNIYSINTGYVFTDIIQRQYPDIVFHYKSNLIGCYGWENLISYNTHPPIDYKNFVCSFNASAHVSRKLLVSIIKKFGYFDPAYSSKVFQFDQINVDGHLSEYLSLDQARIYNKFFTTDDEFGSLMNEFEYDVCSTPQSIVKHYHILKNMVYLENKLTESFLHIVSETMATSYYPFITEKFLYSVITRGLFLAYGPPGWHHHLETYYGFKKYNKIFDYKFDAIENPVERLVELMSMISKFSKLSVDEWKDLYLIEQDAIEYNYNHYFSLSHLTHLQQHAR